MRTSQSVVASWGKFTLVAALVTLLAGCATQKIDWAGRTGNYTFDQAVIEFGPPDKQAKLEDGTVVAEWLTRRGYRQVYPRGAYYGYWSPWDYGPFYPGYIDSYSPDYFLRLTFGPDGKLKTWKKFAK
ncbi:MAG: hypothetical protein AAB380_05485 [Verrucomicrobiota bacterium]